MIYDFNVGADPEFLVYDPYKEEYYPICGLLGGTKRKPKYVDNGCYIQEDNVMAEVNIPQSNNVDDLHNSLQYIISHINQYLYNKNNLILSKECAAYFHEKYLCSRQAMEAGCDPDFNAWTNKVNPRPKVTEGTIRTAGGHIHVDLTKYYKIDRYKKRRLMSFVKCLDVTLGVPSILLDPDKMRKKLYGKAGAHRLKPYGVEYRVLSNFWTFNKKTIEWVFEGVRHSCTMHLDPSCRRYINRNSDKIISLINDGNEKECEKYINKLSKDLSFNPWPRG